MRTRTLITGLAALLLAAASAPAVADERIECRPIGNCEARTAAVLTNPNINVTPDDRGDRYVYVCAKGKAADCNKTLRNMNTQLSFTDKRKVFHCWPATVCRGRYVAAATNRHFDLSVVGHTVEGRERDAIRFRCKPDRTDSCNRTLGAMRWLAKKEFTEPE
ncbi:hypothetical protein G5C51_09025 [Streptomyces sp. A7024]|uniref:Secreted protein n=1 Tax=Streptomyces coryli TaxID=1128680 RepID=A0A6G4TYD6_9ACTN|nr:hypothetical protein [Streptomyces coryli]NGN64047.1 hypothetical protein [Streptomyces coryli]